MKLRYECDVCHTIYWSRRAARFCEEGLVRPQRYQVGMYAYYINDKMAEFSKIERAWVGADSPPNTLLSWDDPRGSRKLDEGIAIITKAYNPLFMHESHYQISGLYGMDEEEYTNVIRQTTITIAEDHFRWLLKYYSTEGDISTLKEYVGWQDKPLTTLDEIRKVIEHIQFGTKPNA